MSETLKPESNLETSVESPESVYPTKDFGFLPIPSYLRYYDGRPQKFGFILQVVFVMASTFTVANLYYCQPLLLTLSEDFHVTHSEVSKIPTLTQAGYALGLLLVSPLGDLVRRRPLLLLLVTISGSLSIGLAITKSVVAFEILSFFIGVATVTPQVLIPLSADLAPPERRAGAISIVYAGLLLGILIARVLAGVIGDFASFRVVYYMGFGVQYAILLFMYFLIPDYPAKDPGIGYFGILKSMVRFAVTEPILIQACLVSCASSAVFVSFWVTLTFLLGGAPYNYDDLKIGLFGLIGALGVGTAPMVGRFIDTLVPWNASIIATLILLVFQAVQTIGGGINISAVILATFGLDVGRQMQQVSLSTNIFAIDPKARARLNAVYIFSIFLGQLMGTATSTKVFLQHGWRAAAVLSLAWIAFQFFILIIRGPHVSQHTWFGWEGGWSYRRHPAPKDNDVIKPASNSEHSENVNRADDLEMGRKSIDETIIGQAVEEDVQPEANDRDDVKSRSVTNVDDVDEKRQTQTPETKS